MDEVEEAIEKVNRAARKGQVPKLSISQLYKMMDPVKIMANGSMAILLNIPIVMEEKFHQFHVMPLPMNGSAKIPDVEVHDIIISQKLMLYMDRPAVIRINDTLSITADQVNTVHKIQEGSDCAMLVLVKKRASCPMIPLPEVYDEWFDTPMHNKVAFYSNQRKEMICEHHREEIEISAGIIDIPKDCVIDTPTKTIFASQNKNKIVRHAFHVEVNDTIDWTPGATSRRPEGSRKMKAVDDSSLDDTLKDAVSVSEAFNTWNWMSICITVAVAGAVVIMVIVLTVWLVKRKPQEESDDEMELHHRSRIDHDCIPRPTLEDDGIPRSNTPEEPTYGELNNNIQSTYTNPRAKPRALHSPGGENVHTQKCQHALRNGERSAKCTCAVGARSRT